MRRRSPRPCAVKAAAGAGSRVMRRWPKLDGSDTKSRRWGPLRFWREHGRGRAAAAAVAARCNRTWWAAMATLLPVPADERDQWRCPCRQHMAFPREFMLVPPRRSTVARGPCAWAPKCSRPSKACCTAGLSTRWATKGGLLARIWRATMPPVRCWWEADRGRLAIKAGEQFPWARMLASTESTADGRYARWRQLIRPLRWSDSSQPW